MLLNCTALQKQWKYCVFLPHVFPLFFFLLIFKQLFHIMIRSFSQSYVNHAEIVEIVPIYHDII